MSHHQQQHQLTVQLDIRDPRYADMIAQAINVDVEPRPDRIQRDISSEACALRIKYTSSDIKLIRTACSGLLENVGLAIKVIDELSPEALGPEGHIK